MNEVGGSGEMEPRTTPYGLVFAHELFEAQLFPAIRAEAADREAASRSFETFLGLEEVRGLLERLMPERPDGSAESAAMLAQHAHLLFHAYHFWHEGQRTFVLDAATTRRLLAPGRWHVERDTRPPSPAGYVQLPPNLLWSRLAEGATPEPVDGFFWTLAQEGAAERLELALPLGVRSGRSGFGQLEAGAPLEQSGFAAWEALPGRDDAADFANILPGGELGELHAVTTTVEALKLAGRLFQYLREHGATLPAEHDVTPVSDEHG